MSRPNRGGFTLIEVLVALFVTATIALLAHALFASAVDGSRRLGLARQGLDRGSNASGFVRDAFLALDVGADSAGPFEGEAHRVRFSTWLPVSGGWNERQQVVLALSQDRWTADIGDPPADRLLLADSIASVGFDYLLDLGVGEHWVREWHSAVSAPLAVRVRRTHVNGTCDTTLYLVKSRG